MSTPLVVPLREGVFNLTFDQRVVWGRCPVCNAEPGERCQVSVGIKGDDPFFGEGVHLGRFSAAPSRVRIEALP